MVINNFGGGGLDTSDATAINEDILKYKTAYVNGEKVIGTIPIKEGESYFTPGTEDQIIESKQYLNQDQIVAGDVNLLPENIRANTSIFGVTGTFTSDATADASKVLKWYPVYINGEKVMGTIPIHGSGSRIHIAKTEDQVLEAGSYIADYHIVKGDSKLLPENIKKNITIFGVTGRLDSVPGTIVERGEAETETPNLKSIKLSLNQNKDDLAATTVGNYAVFGGGCSVSGYARGGTDAINASLTKASINNLYEDRYNLAATTVGDYAIFAGGYSQDPSNIVDPYSSSLVHEVASSFLQSARFRLAGASIGDYAIFAGGFYYGYVSDVETYDSSLTRSSELLSLTEAKADIGATTVGNYALFAGGSCSSEEGSSVDRSSKVEVYDRSLTHTNATELSQKRSSIAATTIGNYAIFGGGYVSGVYSDVVEAYNNSLTHTILPSFSIARETYSTTVSNCALFVGGRISSDRTNAVDAYSDSLTRILITVINPETRSGMSATTIGDYALFGGGPTGEVWNSDVDVYTIHCNYVYYT